MCFLALGLDELAREVSHKCSVNEERELQLHRPMQPIPNNAQSPFEAFLLSSPPQSTIDTRATSYPITEILQAAVADIEGERFCSRKSERLDVSERRNDTERKNVRGQESKQHDRIVIKLDLQSPTLRFHEFDVLLLLRVKRYIERREQSRAEYELLDHP